MAVTPWGDLYPCHQFVGDPNYKLGNVWDGVTNTALRDEFKLCNVYARPDCKDCWARLYCAGGCAANALHATGDIHGTYEYGCKVFRKRMECALMMQVAQRLDPELAKNAVRFESDCDGCGEGNDGACEKKVKIPPKGDEAFRGTFCVAAVPAIAALSADGGALLLQPDLFVLGQAGAQHLVDMGVVVVQPVDLVAAQLVHQHGRCGDGHQRQRGKAKPVAVLIVAEVDALQLVLNADADLVGLVDAGLVGDRHAGLEDDGVVRAQALGAFMHIGDEADAVAGAAAVVDLVRPDGPRAKVSSAKPVQ